MFYVALNYFFFFFYSSPPPQKLISFPFHLESKKILILTLLALLNFNLLCVFSFSPLLNSTIFNFSFPFFLPLFFALHLNLLLLSLHQTLTIPIYCNNIIFLFAFLHYLSLLFTMHDYLSEPLYTSTYLLLSPFFLCKTIWPLFLDPTRHLPWNIASSPS